MKFITLNNGNEMPVLGMGTYRLLNETEITNVIKTAYENGITLIDTAEFYNNERQIGNAIKNLSLNRNELFITSKVWNSEQGFGQTLKSFENTLKKLQTDYLDLYLIHWPVSDKFQDTWKAMEHLYEQKLIKNIGVSNFNIHHLKVLFKSAKIIPAVNQIELHPYMQQRTLRKFCEQHNIAVECWSPLAKGAVASDNILNQIGKKYGKTAVQICLNHQIAEGLITIPKSARPHRIIEFAEVLNFTLSGQDIERINNLDRSRRIGPDPDNFDF